MFIDRISDLVGATDAELDVRIRELELQRRRLEAELAGTIAVATGRGLHLADGHRSMAAYLRATCNWSNGEAARFRGASRLIDSHAPIGEAWLDGRIGSAQVAELSRVHANKRAADRFGEFVPALVEHAEKLPFADFRVVAQRFVLLADSDGTLDDRDAINARSALVTDIDGVLDVRASGGDRLATAEFLAIFERFVDAEFKHDQLTQQERAASIPGDVASGDVAPGEVTASPPRTGRQRRFDALLAMARAAAAHDGHIIRAEPLVSILCDQRTWSWVIAQSGLGSATSLDGASIDPFTGLPQSTDLLDDLLGRPDALSERRCVTTTGVPLRPTDVLRAALSGHTRRVVLGAKRRPIDMGRAERVFTGAARDAAKLLVEWCEHPGCDMPVSLCQVDHSIEWNELGRTDQANAGVRCGLHNREKHRAKRTVRRGLDGCNYTLRPDGSIMLPVGCRPPKRVPDDNDDADDVTSELTAEEEHTVIQAARNRLRLLTAR